MSLQGNSLNNNPYANRLNPKENNLLLYNSYNNINTNKSIDFYQSLKNNQYNQIGPLNLNNNMSKYSSKTAVDNRGKTLDKKLNKNNVDRVKRNLSSSGVLKPSKRDKKYDKVIKNGKKIKNIDINRDYDEKPDDDVSSNASATNNMFKNKLIEQNKQNSNIQTINKNEDNIKRSNTQFLISKQKELNFIGKSTIFPNNQINDPNTFNISLNTNPYPNPYPNPNQTPIPSTSSPYLTQGFNSPLLDINENYIYEEIPESKQIFNQKEQVNTISSNRGFRMCYQISKAGKNIDGFEKTDQDTPLISLDVGGIVGLNIFGVLDGHGNDGHFVSQFLKDYFIKEMQSYVTNLLYTTQYITAEDIYINLKNDEFSYIVDLFIKADSVLATQSNFDYTFSGTTCNLIFQFNEHLVCCSVGDSRSILIEDSEDHIHQYILSLSIDHKPDLEGEIERIESCGGTIDQIEDFYGNKLGPMRVFKAGCNYPGLAMSRSLGDLQAKECGVISTPQIFEYKKNVNSKYFVVCSDGIWEFLTNEQVQEIASIYYSKNDIVGMCNELVNTAVNIWEEKEKIRDDITVVAVFF